MRTPLRRLVAFAAFATTAAAAAVLPAPAARADGPTERETPRFTLSPSYRAGDRFRVDRLFRQRALTFNGDSPRNLKPAGNPSDYDATVHVDALVTIEQVDTDGTASVWTAHFDSFSYDLPDPLQSKEYRDRRHERKAKNLPVDSHPLETETVKVDRSGPKIRVFRVSDKGADYAITTRYPEVLPLMQELVEPDWVPVDAIPMGGSWEMNADHVFRFTRVLMRAPLKGTIECRLVGVAGTKARIAFTANLHEMYAKIEMRIQVHGTIEFDLAAHRPAATEYKGEVQISAEGSSFGGSGWVEGWVHVATADANGQTSK